jgi:Molecular chaperone
MSKVIGIDLGTTNSAVAVLEGGSPRLLQTQKAQEQLLQLLPSKMVKFKLVKLQSVKQSLTRYSFINQASHG